MKEYNQEELEALIDNLQVEVFDLKDKIKRSHMNEYREIINEILSTANEMYSNYDSEKDYKIVFKLIIDYIENFKKSQIMDLFEFIKTFFDQRYKWGDVSKASKKKNSFMTNRFFAIAHPAQANALNHVKINTVYSMDVWQNFFKTKYNVSPFWLSYTKNTKKSTEDKKSKKGIASRDIINEYCKAYRMDIKTVNDALLIFPDKMNEELKQFEKTITNKK